MRQPPDLGGCVMKPVAASLAAEVVLDHLGELPEVRLATTAVLLVYL